MKPKPAGVIWFRSDSRLTRPLAGSPALARPAARHRPAPSGPLIAVQLLVNSSLGIQHNRPQIVRNAAFLAHHHQIQPQGGVRQHVAGRRGKQPSVWRVIPAIETGIIQQHLWRVEIGVKGDGKKLPVRRPGGVCQQDFAFVQNSCSCAGKNPAGDTA